MIFNSTYPIIQPFKSQIRKISHSCRRKYSTIAGDHNNKKNEQNINIRGVSSLYQNDSEFNQTDYTNDVETNASPLDDTSVEIRETNVAELKDAKEAIEKAMDTLNQM